MNEDVYFVKKRQIDGVYFPKPIVYKTLNKMGYVCPKPDELPEAEKKEAICIDDIMASGRVSPKDILILRDTLYDMRIDPIENPVVNPGHFVPQNLDLSEYRDALISFFTCIWPKNEAVGKEVFAIEELSELTIELQTVIKAMMKCRRGKASSLSVFDEACDVFCTLFNYLLAEGFTMCDIFEEIKRKLARALGKTVEENNK